MQRKEIEILDQEISVDLAHKAWMKGKDLLIILLEKIPPIFSLKNV